MPNLELLTQAPHDKESQNPDAEKHRIAEAKSAAG